MRDRIRIAISALLVGLALAGCGGGGSVTPSLHGPGSQNVSTVRDDWPMYGHDARHTSVSVASISGSLKVAWRYDPQPIAGDSFGSSFNSIASVSGVYVHWDQYGSGVFSGGPSYDGISISGQRLWSYCEHRDFDEGHWASVFHSNVVFEDDGQGFLDENSGAVVKTPAKKWSTGYDLWGESIPDSSGLYSANTFLADGADLFVYALDSTGAARWTQKQQKSTKYSQDQDGALVLDTPGMRELHLWAHANSLGEAFADIQALAQRCRFRDCQHAGEPGCAVRSALGTELDPARLANFVKLQRELASVARQRTKHRR